MDISQMKLPIVLVVGICIQSAGAVWYFAQQNSTISSLKEDVSALTERISIEQTVNLERDVKEAQRNIQTLHSDYEELEDKIETIELSVHHLENSVSVLQAQTGSRGAAGYSNYSHYSNYNQKDGWAE